MKIFMDTEFTGLHQNTSLISIGLISEDGKMFYAEFNDYKKHEVDSWIQKSVIDNLIIKNKKIDLTSAIKESNDDLVVMTGSSNQIKPYLIGWLNQFDNIEIWSDCLSYDWVLFCELCSNGAINLPKNIYYIPFDISTLFKMKNIDPDISRENFAKEWIEQNPFILKNTKHNSLWDAYVIKGCYETLINKKEK